jgi:death on curing protein
MRHSENISSDIFEMAADYAFHISQNHPFIDGNKRTALASALIFLELNGISITDTDGELYDATIQLVGKLDKAAFRSILKRMA